MYRSITEIHEAHSGHKNCDCVVEDLAGRKVLARNGLPTCDSQRFPCPETEGKRTR